MSKIAISGASTGTATFTIESPATSTNRTLILPDNTGTILTSGTAATSIPGYGNLTEADQWRLSGNLTLTADADITTNLERNDNSGFGYIGSGMSQSSGIFTFPQTGIWLIKAVGSFFQNAGASTSNALFIRTTIDNSSYTLQTSTNTFADASDDHSCSYSEFMFDVTSTTNCKVKFSIGGSNGLARGNTGQNQTHFTFIRLGDT
jgi:hypothetical protein